MNNIKIWLLCICVTMMVMFFVGGCSSTDIPSDEVIHKTILDFETEGRNKDESKDNHVAPSYLIKAKRLQSYKLNNSFFSDIQ